MHTNLRTFLKELEEYGRAHDAQESEHSRKLLNLEADTAELVSILAQSSSAKCALEIGSSNGYSTIWLAASIGPSGGRVISIERSREKQTMARENLVKAGLSDFLDLRLGDATEVIQTLPGPFDFVFFDADRTSAPDQLRLLLPLLSSRALVLADNALSHPEEIAGYVKLPAFHSIVFKNVLYLVVEIYIRSKLDSLNSVLPFSHFRPPLPSGSNAHHAISTREFTVHAFPRTPSLSTLWRWET